MRNTLSFLVNATFLGLGLLVFGLCVAVLVFAPVWIAYDVLRWDAGAVGLAFFVWLCVLGAAFAILVGKVYDR